MSLTFYLILLAALALSVVLLAAMAIYWHAEARDWMRIALQEFDAIKARDAILKREGNGAEGPKIGGACNGNRSAD
ncbi:hypothetical protein [uncultured Senegalimassilia sp.]|uniref:hypothetical protein n=1 Tax=uncultured Senegalimassilia sp. TaxID=1714350 RepID=UPI0026058330|nr:hypothetical protein [uncultured Senegalimassilia sp.]